MLYNTEPSGHNRMTSLASVMACLRPSLIPGKWVSGTQMNFSISGLKASLLRYPVWLYFKRSSFQYCRKYMIVVNSCFKILFLHRVEWTTFHSEIPTFSHVGLKSSYSFLVWRVLGQFIIAFWLHSHKTFNVKRLWKMRLSKIRFNVSQCLLHKFNVPKS